MCGNRQLIVKSQIHFLQKGYQDPLNSVEVDCQLITQSQKQALQKENSQEHQIELFAESPNTYSSISNRDTMLPEVELSQEDSENQDIQFKQIFEEESSSYQTSSSKSYYNEQLLSNKNQLDCNTNLYSENNNQNLTGDNQKLKFYFKQLKSCYPEDSQQINSQNLIKKYLSENKNQFKQQQIPLYKVLPIDYDDLPTNKFHLYGDIFIEIMKPNQSSLQAQEYGQDVILQCNKQINSIFQWKHISQMKISKRELIFDLTSKTETQKNFNSIINILKALKQQKQLTKLLIEVQNNLLKTKNQIKDGFNLMRQYELIELFYQRRQLFQNKCEFFLKEISGQKKYIFLKSFYNEDKLEIEYSQMGISTNLVEILSGQQVNQVAYKILRGNYPEILGKKLKEIWSQQSAIRLLSFEQNNYRELKFENMELNTIDGLPFTTTMTVKKVQFRYDPIYENLPLKDQFVYIEFNVSPKVLQQINKMRKDISTIKLQSNSSQSRSLCLDQQLLTSLSIFQQVEVKKSLFSAQIEYKDKPSLNQSFCLAEQAKNENFQISQQPNSEFDIEKNSQFILQTTMKSLNKKQKYFQSQIKPKSKEFNSIKNKKRKLNGFIEEDNKDFYYEMQTQLLLDKFYNYEEIKELVKQSFQTNIQSFPLQTQANSFIQYSNYFAQ
ncbi:hypothetical protein ABPG72_021029 [Tetrahymena utriculariae]